jgi:hypothetical protein
LAAGRLVVERNNPSFTVSHQSQAEGHESEGHKETAMRHGLSFGYSTAAEMSHSENSWKEKLRRIGLFLLLVLLLGLFFRHIAHSLDRKIATPNPNQVTWNLETQ